MNKVLHQITFCCLDKVTERENNQNRTKTKQSYFTSTALVPVSMLLTEKNAFDHHTILWGNAYL